MRQAGGLCGYAFENIVNETIHDAHGFAGYSSIRMDLFQNLVYVNGVALLPPSLLFFVGFRDVFLRFSCLFGSFAASLGWHFYKLLNTDTNTHTYTVQ